MSKPLHVPPQNQSPKGTGDLKTEHADKRSQTAQRSGNTHQQGQQANTEQNTNHQGYQQDR